MSFLGKSELIELIEFFNNNKNEEFLRLWIQKFSFSWKIQNIYKTLIPLFSFEKFSIRSEYENWVNNFDTHNIVYVYIAHQLQRAMFIAIWWRNWNFIPHDKLCNGFAALD